MHRSTIMRTFAHKPKMPAIRASSVNRAHFGRNHDPNPILDLQRMMGNQAASRVLQSNAIFPPVVHDVLRKSARPLDPSVCTFMEMRFGHDFSNVRLHTDNEAAEAAGTLQARAYTIGHEIVFGDGQYQPATSDGKQLLAHELTHVIQQTGSRSANRYGEAGLGADPGRPTDGIDSVATHSVVRLTAPVQPAFKPKHAPKKPVVSREITEAMVKKEVARLRDKIPFSWNIFGMMNFDSHFYGNTRLFNFRGKVMNGSELNNYFIGMAMSHQCYSWSGAEFMIDFWNTTQYIFEGDPTITEGMLFAAKEGYFDEARRRGACWDPTKLDKQPFDPMSGF